LTKKDAPYVTSSTLIMMALSHPTRVRDNPILQPKSPSPVTPSSSVIQTATVVLVSVAQLESSKEDSMMSQVQQHHFRALAQLIWKPKTD
jgi:hypothetical protein